MRKEKMAVLLDISGFVLAVCGMLIAALSNDLVPAGCFFALAIIGWAMAIYHSKVFKKRLAEE